MAHSLEWLHWAMSVIGAATVMLLFIPTPEKFAEVFVYDKAPLWYIRTYNVCRYVATLNPKAGWTENRATDKNAPNT